MAGVTKVNPATYGTGVEFLTKKLTYLDIDFNGDISGKLGPNSTVKQVFDAIMNAGVNIVIIGPTHSTDNNISIAVEGEYGTDTYDGTNSETLAAHLEDVVQALGTVDSIALASATVTAKTFVL
jgi:hypothetical protein